MLFFLLLSTWAIISIGQSDCRWHLAQYYCPFSFTEKFCKIVSEVMAAARRTLEESQILDTIDDDGSDFDVEESSEDEFSVYGAASSSDSK